LALEKDDTSEIDPDIPLVFCLFTGLEKTSDDGSGCYTYVPRQRANPTTDAAKSIIRVFVMLVINDQQLQILSYRAHSISLMHR